MIQTGACSSPWGLEQDVPGCVITAQPNSTPRITILQRMSVATSQVDV